MIRKIRDFFVSMRLMAVLISIFALSIAIATFIENDFGTPAAKATVYNARWFELLLLMLCINLISNIFINRLYSPRKFTIFLFHFSFVIILLGAFITRYIGWEGYMGIREGKTSNEILTTKTYIQVHAQQDNIVKQTTDHVLFSSLTPNRYNNRFNFNGEQVHIKSIGYIPNATEALIPDEDGHEMIEIITTGVNGRKSIFLKKGEQTVIGNQSLIFNDTSRQADIHIFEANDGLYLKSSAPIQITDKNIWSDTSLEINKAYPFVAKTLYKADGHIFVLKQHLQKAKIALIPPDDQNNEQGLNAVLLKLTSGNQSTEQVLWGQPNATGVPTTFTFNNIDFTMTYGSVIRTVPFSITLKDFRLDRYPGSKSPSSFESYVVLNDPQKGIQQERKIFMNNVLKHRGFKFYQSSYDADEKGTVLSVNKDFWGTTFTYAGYILLALGMFSSLFNTNSRFKRLQRATAKASLILFIYLIPSVVNAADDHWEEHFQENIIDADHAAEFGKLLVQDNQGRIKPVNTLSSQIVRKVTRKDNFEGITPDQVFLGMLSNPGFWQTVPMIKISHEGINDVIGSDENYVSFFKLITDNHQKGYILGPYAEEANRKKPAYRSKFDNEIIRVDERVNICYLTYTGELLRIFPDPKSHNNKWLTPNDSLQVFQDGEAILINRIIPFYFSEVNKAIKTGDWNAANEYLSYIRLYQEKQGSEIMPPPRKVKIELWYNKANIFDRISSFYGLFGFVFLLLNFIAILKPAIKTKIANKIGLVLILLTFIAHAGGLAARWYIAGHAPWSNGYEALIYISWATVLSGLIFSGKSPVTLPVTAILAFLILHVAHLSWMDPEITTLVPVLKSVWLVIHVAIITASYGFLGLSAILALVNILLMNFKTTSNKFKIDENIANLSAILEMTMTVGLYMLTIGTFLGGVWANESWGRYWGWDPKETWALITILVYAFIVHMRMVSGLKGFYAFNVMALFGFSSVIMTYFGVNYYLAGLHSYAKGDPLPVPDFVIYTITALTVISILAFINHKRVGSTID